MIITSRLNFSSGPNPDPAYQWDTKRKLISLAEVCSPPSALLFLLYFRPCVTVYVLYTTDRPDLDSDLN